MERLRAFVAGDMILAEEAIAEAADGIERLRAENARLREALEEQVQSPSSSAAREALTGREDVP